MRILFVTKRFTLKRFVGVVRELCLEGNEVVVGYPRGRRDRVPRRLRDLSNVTVAQYELSDERYGEALALLRHLRDYAWYLSPELAVASFNRRRALDWLVQAASGGALHADPAWPDPLLPIDAEAAARLEACLAELEARLPPDPGALRFVEEQEPDVVLVSPLVRGMDQSEVVKAARSLEIPTAALILSWDNLSNKQRIHVPPDRVFVWNDVQRREAMELHGIAPEQVVVTGAPHWDGFFELSPSVGRDELYQEHGFDPAEPIVLYLGSTNEVCSDEPALVEQWVAALRSRPGRAARANVLVRRHPREGQRWAGWTPSAPRVSASKDVHRAGQDLYDELFHASVVVGLNTSAQIEAAIVGRPVYTFSAGTDAPAQGGSRHFYYLLEENGGAVSFAPTLEEHVVQLEQGLAGEYDQEAIARFAELFVRPRGIDRRVAPIVAQEILELAGVASGVSTG
ncbi:MAG TPA: hypothetical protein VH760_02140 [Gaiellaceae bacterium]|jgi:hypothetical protein